MASEHSAPSFFEIELVGLIQAGTALLLAVFVVIFVYCWDSRARKKQLKLATIHYDAKGFSSNELFLLNSKNVDVGVVEGAKVFPKGPCHLFTAQNLSLPSGEFAPSDFLAKSSAQSSSLPTSESRFKVSEVLEYLDLTNLPIQAISDFPNSQNSGGGGVPISRKWPSTPSPSFPSPANKSQPPGKDESKESNEKTNPGTSERLLKTDTTACSAEKISAEKLKLSTPSSSVNEKKSVKQTSMQEVTPESARSNTHGPSLYSEEAFK